MFLYIYIYFNKLQIFFIRVMHVLQYNIKIGFKKHLKSKTIQPFFLSEDLLPL